MSKLLPYLHAAATFNTDKYSFQASSFEGGSAIAPLQFFWILLNLCCTDMSDFGNFSTVFKWQNTVDSKVWSSTYCLGWIDLYLHILIVNDRWTSSPPLVPLLNFAYHLQVLAFGTDVPLTPQMFWTAPFAVLASLNWSKLKFRICWPWLDITVTL